jgi:hypothetical protein
VPPAHATWSYEEIGTAPERGFGKTVVYATTRSSSTSKAAGECGTRLQCIRAAIREANARTMWSVASVSLVKVDGWNMESQQPTATHIDLSRFSGLQTWQAPNVDMGWNGDHDGIREFDAGVNKLSYGGTTSLRGGVDGVQAALRSPTSTRPPRGSSSSSPTARASTGSLAASTAARRGTTTSSGWRAAASRTA